MDILMIYYNFITIILFLIIFILILKFRDINIDNFNDFDINECYKHHNSIECDTIKIFNNSKINKKIIDVISNELHSFNNSFNESTNNKMDKFILDKNNTNKKITTINANISKLKDETNKKLKYYNTGKDVYQMNLLNYLDDEKDGNESEQYILKNHEYTAKNKEAITKLTNYYNKLKSLKKLNKTDNSNILILKNNYNKKELNLVKQSATFKTFGLSSSDESKDNALYWLIINNGCVKFNNKTDFNIETCKKDKHFNYVVVKIDTPSLYNKYIMYDKNSRETDKVAEDQYGVKYPFFIISPFSNLGYCVTYTENKLYIKPIKDDPTQRFNLASESNYCQY
jgi:hypothetical protein